MTEKARTLRKKSDHRGWCRRCQRRRPGAKQAHFAAAELAITIEIEQFEFPLRLDFALCSNPLAPRRVRCSRRARAKPSRAQGRCRGGCVPQARGMALVRRAISEGVVSHRNMAPPGAGSSRPGCTVLDGRLAMPLLTWPAGTCSAAEVTWPVWSSKKKSGSTRAGTPLGHAAEEHRLVHGDVPAHQCLDGAFVRRCAARRDQGGADAHAGRHCAAGGAGPRERA